MSIGKIDLNKFETKKLNNPLENDDRYLMTLSRSDGVVFSQNTNGYEFTLLRETAETYSVILITEETQMILGGVWNDVLKNEIIPEILSRYLKPETLSILKKLI